MLGKVLENGNKIVFDLTEGEIQMVKNLENSLGKNHHDERLKYFGIQDGYLCATDAAMLHRVKINLDKDISGRNLYNYDLKDNHLVLTKTTVLDSKKEPQEHLNFSCAVPSIHDIEVKLDTQAITEIFKTYKHYFKKTEKRTSKVEYKFEAVGTRVFWITLESGSAYFFNEKIGETNYTGILNIAIDWSKLKIMINSFENTSTVYLNKEGITNNQYYYPIHYKGNRGDFTLMPLPENRPINPSIFMENYKKMKEYQENREV